MDVQHLQAKASTCSKGNSTQYCGALEIFWTSCYFVTDCCATLSGHYKDVRVAATLHSTLLVKVGSNLWNMRTAGLVHWLQKCCLVILPQAGIRQRSVFLIQAAA